MVYDSVILGENAVFSTDSRETQVNNNILVCGSSGCGKTMSISEPKLLCTNHASLVITLSKRRLVKIYSELFKKRGYRVLDMNFVRSWRLMKTFNPLSASVT